MTALDSGTPQLPVCDWVIVIPQAPMFSRKPLARSMAAEAPTAPEISTTFFLVLSLSRSHMALALLWPSSMKSEPM